MMERMLLSRPKIRRTRNARINLRAVGIVYDDTTCKEALNLKTPGLGPRT